MFVAWLPLLFASWAMAQPGPTIRIVGAGNCPTEEQVRDALHGFGAMTPGGVAELQQTKDRLLIRVRKSSGGLLERTLLAQAPCGDLAQAVAVILASAWQDLDASRGPIGPIDLLTSVAPATPAIPPQPGLVSLPPKPLGTFGAFVGFALNEDQKGQAVVGLSAQLSIRGRWPLLIANLFAPLPRTAALGPGSFAWSRMALSVGLGFTPVSTTHLDLTIYGEGALGLMLVSGSGFVMSTSSAAPDGGLGGGLRLRLRSGVISPYVGAMIYGWLNPQRVRAQGLVEPFALPQLSALFVAGADTGRFR